jgi:hypothetical protein
MSLMAHWLGLLLGPVFELLAGIARVVLGI